MKSRTALALATVAGIALAGAVTTTSSAALNTSCVGTAGAVTVPGNLFVPAGKSCVLDGTTVEGTVTVRAGADLVVTDGTFKGTVLIQENGYLDAFNTKVTGKVTSRGGYGASFGGGATFAGFAGTAPTDTSIVPFAYFEDSDSSKDISSVSGELYLGSTFVTGSVTGDGTAYTDLLDSTVTGKLTAKGNADGSVVCGSEIDGIAHWDGNGAVQVGGGGLIDDCSDVNVFGSHVTIDNNTGGVSMVGNIVRGNVGGTGNTPAPTGSDNRVRGTLTGQFADLQPAAAAKARRAAPQDRGDALAEKAADRKADAVAEGKAAGKAKL